jgi:hypothetical protein
MVARNVEEGRPKAGHNEAGAESSADLRDYHARKRLICVRTSLFLIPLVALAAVRDPVASLQLALGGALGVLNMLLVMRENERLLSGGRSRAIFTLNGQVRILAVGILPVAVALRLGHFWTIALYIAGFFTPLVLYALDYRRRIQRGL